MGRRELLQAHFDTLKTGFSSHSVHVCYRTAPAPLLHSACKASLPAACVPNRGTRMQVKLESLEDDAIIAQVTRLNGEPQTKEVHILVRDIGPRPRACRTSRHFHAGSKQLCRQVSETYPSGRSIVGDGHEFAGDLASILGKLYVRIPPRDHLASTSVPPSHVATAAIHRQVCSFRGCGGSAVLRCAPPPAWHTPPLRTPCALYSVTQVMRCHIMSVVCQVVRLRHARVRRSTQPFDSAGACLRLSVPCHLCHACSRCMFACRLGATSIGYSRPCSGQRSLSLSVVAD